MIFAVFDPSPLTVCLRAKLSNATGRTYSIDKERRQQCCQNDNSVIRLEARLPPNIGFALRCDLAVFTRSTITPTKINRFGVKFGALLVHFGGLFLAHFGRDPGTFWARSAQ